jgi:hypothetical protein
MRQWRMGTLTLGFLLIALGCGFILSKLGIINSIVQVLSWWPLAIILLGIEVLFGGFLFVDERCRLKFDGFSVLAILLTLFICTGSFAASLLPLGKFNFNFDFPHRNIFYSDNTNFQKSLSIDASSKEGFSVNNSLGSVQFQKSLGSKIEIQAEIKINYNDYEYAKSISDSIIKVDEGNVISVTSDRGQFDNNKAAVQSIDYIIKVPEKLNIEVNNKFGKVEASDLGGNVRINNTNGSVNVKSIAGTLDIDNKFGEVNTSDISGKAKITNANGRITAIRFSNDLIIDCKFGDVSAGNVKGNLKLSDSNGRIKIDTVDGSVTVDNRFGDIELKNISGTVDAKNENGAISFSSNSLIQKDIKLESRFGSITLNLPKEQAGRFNLSTRHGNIKSDFPISINKDNTSESANTSISNAANLFNIKSENGGISINKN